MNEEAMDQMYSQINDFIQRWIVLHETTFAALDAAEFKTAALNLHETKELLGKCSILYKNMASALNL